MTIKVFFFLILFQLFTNNLGYRYTILPFNLQSPCVPNSKCGAKNSTHTLCVTKPSSHCKNFEIIKWTRTMKMQAISGINGIRNRVAILVDIANMNILHWSRLLSQMARSFLMQCTIGKDECDYIFNSSFDIGQTYYFTNRLPSKNTWHVKPIRSWYTEIASEKGQASIKTYQDFKNLYKNYPNFTQLVWPRSEFVGCAAARMFQGYLMTCFFHPRAKPENFINEVYEGDGCANCDDNRPTCSRLFINLCGLDLPTPTEIEDFSIKSIEPFPIGLILFISFIIFLKRELL